ncbi:hypothetical protein [Nubsella zeaxanthinifaciens]|uniref:hypothetical protein n=1 Tax=Nubsella zeaxanthinifaciens TaxID=392412 RepID=UPI000DE354F4|nr:hypothetical protein [Nubsella zeaxanthinifaciens]
MTEVITNSLQLKADDLQKALALFKERLHMEVDEIGSKSAVVIQGGEALIYLTEERNAKPSTAVQLTTPDCIALYCLLKSKGIVFAQAPTYINEGMVAEFYDAAGNQFLLIEPRNYND